MNLTASELRHAFGLSGSLVTERRIGSVRIAYMVDLDDNEVGRRRANREGAILDRGTINALWEVPSDIDYPSSALPSWVIERVRKFRGAEVGEVVRRNVHPPLIIRGAVARGARLRTLLEVLGPLSSVCPTASIVASAPAPHDHSFLQARQFGVGIAVAHGHNLEVLVRPQVHAPELGAYQWHVAELVYESIVSEGVVRPTR